MDVFKRDAQLVIHNKNLNHRHIKTELIRPKSLVLIATYFTILYGWTSRGSILILLNLQTRYRFTKA
jgi:hypothetical protein